MKSLHTSAPAARRWQHSALWLLLLLAALTISGCVLVPVRTNEPTPTPEGTPAVAPVIAVAPVTGKAGDTLTVSGAGWSASEVVYVNLEAQVDGATQELSVAVATTDDEGRFNVTFLYPFDEPWSTLSSVFVTAYSLQTGERTSAQFTVEESAAPPATPTSTTAPTAQPTAQPTATSRPPAQTLRATVTSVSLNVRGGPGSNFPIIGLLRRGDVVTVLGQNPNSYWLYVRLPGGSEGWIARPYTDFTGTAPVINVVPPPPAATPTRPAPTATAAPQPGDWRGEYFSNQALAGNPALVRSDRSINFNWGWGAPASNLPSDFFSARWTRESYFAAGTYRFAVRSDDGVRVFLDDRMILDEWRLATGATFLFEVNISEGLHTLRVEYFEETQIAKIEFSYEMVSAAAGWRGEYFANRTLSGSPALVRTDPVIDFDWGSGSPASNLPSDNFSVRWTRSDFFDGGRWRFRILTDDGMRLWVNGRLLIDEWRDGSVRERSAEIDLGAGWHDLRVEFYENTQFARARVTWERADAPPAFPDWRGEYWNNRSLDGEPVVVRNDTNIDFNWGSGSPDGRIRSDDFSARWTRTLFFEEGRYRFRATMDDGMRVFVNDNLIIDEWRENSERERTAEINLGRGDHRIRVEFFERTGTAVARLRWERVDDDDDDDDSFPDWKGEYFSNRDLNGSPTLRRNDRQIDFNWGTGRPDSRLPRDNFSVRWTREVRFEPGTYRFFARADDGIRAWVGGRRIINEWRDSTGSETFTADVELNGRTDLRVEYYERTGGAMAQFRWERIDRTPTPTPTARTPFINVRPESGPAGTQVSVNGGGFPANTVVNIHLGAAVRAAQAGPDPAVYATTTTDSAGNFGLSFTMPDRFLGGEIIEPGELIVLAATNDFAVTANALFTFRAPRPTTSPNPFAEVEPSSGGPGTAVTVVGGGFPANTIINVHLAGVVRTAQTDDPFRYASGRTDANGNYRIGFTMPSAWPDGDPIEQGDLVVLVATDGFTVSASDSFSFRPTPANPQIRLQPNSGGPDTLVTVTGTGYPANEQVDIYLAALDEQVGDAGQGVSYARTVADANGSFAVVFSMPAFWPDGSRVETDQVVVLAANADFSVRASAVFAYAQPQVTPTTPTPSPTPTSTPVASPTAGLNPYASITPAGGDADTQVNISGGGFPANASLGVYLATFDGSHGAGPGAHRYASGVANANGDFSLSFAMPSRWPDESRINAGRLLVVVATDDFDVVASAPFDFSGVSASAVRPTDEEPEEPTAVPTAVPTEEPTEEPTATATRVRPTATPTVEPTEEPAATPTEEPAATPTEEPTRARPTATPTVEPTEEPTAEPTATPTEEPTEEPTVAPTATPTATPTEEPTEEAPPPPPAEPGPGETPGGLRPADEQPIPDADGCFDPRAFILSPLSGDTVAGLLTVYGTAAGDYTLTAGRTLLVEGSAVTEGVLGELDTTTLPNGAVRLRLTVAGAPTDAVCTVTVTVAN